MPARTRNRPQDAKGQTVKALPQAAVLRVDLDPGDHAGFGVMRNLALEFECAGGTRVAEIHAQFHCGVGADAVPGRNCDRIPQLRIGKLLAIHLQKEEMDAVHVKRMYFAGVVRNNPILHSTYLRDHSGRFGPGEQPGRLPLYRQEESRGSAGAIGGFGEI